MPRVSAFLIIPFLSFFFLKYKINFFFPVDHLSKYLAMRLTLDNMDSDLSDSLGLVNFCIYIAPTPGQYVLLNGNQTLRQVNDKYWKADKPLEMYYSINKKT